MQTWGFTDRQRCASSRPCSMPTALRVGLTIGWYAALFGAAFLVAMVASLLATVEVAHVLLWSKVTALFAALGALYGVIIALDPAAPRLLAPWDWIRQVEAPAARTALCSLLGATIGWLVWSFGASSACVGYWTLGALVGAAVGRLGWRGAKYIDF